MSEGRGDGGADSEARPAPPSGSASEGQESGPTPGAASGTPPQPAGSGESTPRQFPCGSCGADLEFAPGTRVLTCPYCTHETEIDASQEPIREIDFHALLAQLADAAEVHEHTTIKCDTCGAEVEKPEHVTAMPCPFCATNIVATGRSQKLIKPQSLLPFSLDRGAANDAFDRWIKGLWFAPNALKRFARLQDRFNGIYLPHWTYDTRTVSRYTGQRGDDYYVTRTRTVTRDGKQVTETYQERKTRWRPASGTVRLTFNDVLVTASRSLPEKYVQKLEPWGLDELVPYSDEYLSGFRSESYQIGLEEGFDKARDIMDGPIRSEVKDDIGGDHQRIHSLDTRYDDLTFKHILLPVWVCAYQYRGKPHRFLVNARTGEVQGERPWSWVKIAFAALTAATVIAAIVYFLNQ